MKLKFGHARIRDRLSRRTPIPHPVRKLTGDPSERATRFAPIEGQHTGPAYLIGPAFCSPGIGEIGGVEDCGEGDMTVARNRLEARRQVYAPVPSGLQVIPKTNELASNAGDEYTSLSSAVHRVTGQSSGSAKR
jgi:hypothetical protein